MIVNILSLYLSLPCTLPPSPNQRARMRDLLILGPQWASNTLPSCIIFEASYVLLSVIKSLASRQNSGSKLLKVQKMLWCHISSTLAPTTTYLLSSYEINPLSKFQIWYSLSVSHSADFVLHLLYSKYAVTPRGHNEKYITVSALQGSTHPSIYLTCLPTEGNFHLHLIL